MKELDGNFAFQVSVVRAVDDTHAPATDFTQNTVVSELGPD